jgi:hypothetical protein
MEASLNKIRQEIIKDGWHETSTGPEPWDLSFTRNTGS